jgi:hypothetical protein
MTTSRSRQHKRRAGRAPGIWRGAAPAAYQQVERPAVEHGVRGQFGLSWRMFSGLIVIVLGLVLALFFLTDFFYVRSVTVGGIRYLDESEVFRYADIAEMHIFWVDPERVRRSIVEASPVVADARVVVGWPPDMVRIVIEEREPALIWVQGGVIALVDLRGRVLRYPPDGEPLPDLIQVIADASISGPPGVEAPLPVDAVTGALQLRNLMGGVQTLRYHPSKGLGFREPGGWDVWLGVGTDMPDKLLIYETLRDRLLAQGTTPVEINVAHPDAAYYCGGIEVCHE